MQLGEHNLLNCNHTRVIVCAKMSIGARAYCRDFEKAITVARTFPSLFTEVEMHWHFCTIAYPRGAISNINLKELMTQWANT